MQTSFTRDIRPLCFVLLGLTLLATACTSGGNADAGDPPCDGHGDLHGEGEDAHCHCDDGYHANGLLSCVVDDADAGDDDHREPGDAGSGDAQDAGIDAGDVDAGNSIDTLPASCTTHAQGCNPITNGGCTAGEACDVGNANGVVGLMCFPPPNEVPLGGACNLHNGPFCEGGAFCMGGTCQKACCSGADCPSAARYCIALDAASGTLGGCFSEEPTCALAGMFCAANTDCCSGDCHSSHCH
jgi:hypothetical protein